MFRLIRKLFFVSGGGIVLSFQICLINTALPRLTREKRSMISTLKMPLHLYVPCVYIPHPDSQQNRGKEELSDAGRLIIASSGTVKEIGKPRSRHIDLER